MRTIFGARIRLLSAILALVAGSAGALSAGPEDEPQPPADPQARAEVETLCRQLSDSDFHVRESANERLLEIGDDAVWALRQVADGKDMEASARAREILEEVAWVPPSQRKRIEDLCAVLRDSGDEAEQARVYQGILQNGKAGQRALQRLFTHPELKPEEIELKVEADVERVARGGAITFRLKMSNRGKEGVWIQRTGLTCSVGTRREVGAYSAPGPKGMLVGIAQDIGMRGSAFGFRFLKPGQAHETTVTLDAMQTDLVGWIEPSVSYRCDGGIQAGIGGGRIVMFRGGMQQPAGPQQVPSAAPLSLEAKGHRVYVLPDLKPAAEAPAAVSVKAPEGPCEAGRTLPLEIAITPRKEDEGVSIAAPRDGAPAEGFWAAWVDGMGRIAFFSAFPGAKEPPEISETVQVGKEGPLRLKGEISVPPTAGAYHLVIGYSAVEGPPGLRMIQRGMPMRRGGRLVPQEPKPDAAAKGAGLWMGHLVADGIPVSVK